MMPSKIKLIFSNSKQEQDLNFLAIDSPMAVRWLNKLKHIHKLPISETDSRLGLLPLENKLDVGKIHKKFCEVSSIPYRSVDYSKQDDLNELHKLYENHHDTVVDIDPGVLYSFHQAIHLKEAIVNKTEFTSLEFGWGEREGPLMERMNMNQHYSDTLAPGNLYIKWSELGKTPFRYFSDGEPNDQHRFNTLSKPNKTLRPKFSLQVDAVKISPFTEKFATWFENYKRGWLEHHGIDDWQPKDEESGVHVAEPVEKYNVKDFINTYPNFEKIELS